MRSSVLLKKFSKHQFNLSHFYGSAGEWLILFYYLCHGFIPLRRHFKGQLNNEPEIDLILRRGRTLALVEVKVRRKQAFMHLALSNTQKERQIKTAQKIAQKYPQHILEHHVAKLCFERPFMVIKKSQTPYI